VTEVPVIPADPGGLDFRFRVGTSILTEFAVSHTPADVLRELVQNEYDAGGTELTVEFGPDALVVRGNGKTIDKAGWDRLGVMLGHGLVAGAVSRVEPKSNGIGSKNFGLRSLFLFGDRIHVMSGGRRTILDRTSGALAEPLADPGSRGRRGVTIAVPYRQVDDRPLRAFGQGHEAEALTTIAAELASTLIKLAHPGPGKNLRAVVLRSARLGHELRWRQSARADKAVPGLIRRSARLDHSGPQLEGVPEAIMEAEYQQVVTPPAGLRRPSVPSYFRVPAGRIRLAVSVRVRRSRLDLAVPGIFYYPIGATRSRTGFGFSISAPFEMTEDRSQLIDPQNSDWNAWLVRESAALAVRLLPGRLFAAFGPDAFHALDPRAAASSTVPDLTAEIDRLLRTEPCWPTQATVRRNGRIVPAPAASLMVPASPVLSAFTVSTLRPAGLLHADLAVRADMRAMAVALGAKGFTAGSLVRLRCAGASAQNLTTSLGDMEASRYFTEFPADLQDLAIQQRFAIALDGCRLELSDENRKDLRTSATTMTRAETLSSPGALWVAGEALATAVPAEQTLHPGLAGSRVLAGLCRRFNFSGWAADTANRITDGTASRQERDALALYIRGRPALSQKAWAALRRSPVIPDHRGEWTAPADMVSRSASGAALLEPALHLPARADEANESLRPLRLRRAVRGSDLVALARLVEQGTVPPAAMSRAVGRLQRLLTPAVLTQLNGIRFLDTGPGTVTAPADAYLRSDRIVAILGEGAPYASGIPASLLQRLGCRTAPRADDIIAALAKLREENRGLSRPDLVYPALVAALRAERRPAGQLRDQLVAWAGDRWEAPGDCLTGADNRGALLDAVTVLPEALRDAWVFLGAAQRPTEDHWRRLLVRAGELYGGQQQVPQRPADVLRRAYRHLGKLPERLSPGTNCLLDDHRHLHSPSEAAARTYLINDDPALASAAQAQGAPVAFADTSDPRVNAFFQAAGTQPLSAAAALAGTTYGPDTRPDDTLRTGAVLARLHTSAFGSAVAALASAVCGPSRSRTAASLTARLAQITQIAIVNGITRTYHLVGNDVTVAADYDLAENQIVLDQVASSHEVRRLAASAIAVLVGAGPLGEQVLGDGVYFLLRCRSAREMQRELQRRKVAWQPATLPDAATDDEDDDEDLASLAGALSRNLVREAMSGPAGSTSRTQPPPAPSPPRPARAPLPDLGLVRPRPAGTGMPQPPSHAGSSGGGYGTWSPRSPREAEDDRALGRRGEEIVLAIERERVSRLGLPADRVTWTADAIPSADHDIASVDDDDGSELWVEVKSTTGRDGQFSWTAAEFRLAVRARDRYILYRVFEADTTTPSWSRIRDPIGAFEAGELRLDIDRLTGDTGPLAQPRPPTARNSL
jgi:hypothetical protein